MADLDDEPGDNQLTPAMVTGTMLRVACKFDAVLGRPERVPEEMEEDELRAYAAAINALIGQIEKREGAEFKVTMLAELANRAFQDEAGLPIRPWSQINPALQEKWRFFVKHFWNMLDYDADDDGAVVEHEGKIAAMFEATLKQRGLLVPR